MKGFSLVRVGSVCIAFYGSTQEFETGFRSWQLTHTMIKSKFVSFDSTKSIGPMRNNLCFIIQAFYNSIGNRNFKIV